VGRLFAALVASRRAALTVAVTYSMVVPGRPRRRRWCRPSWSARWLARLLAVDHPFDQLAPSLAVGIMDAFRFFTPNGSRLRAVGANRPTWTPGRRADAIRRAVEDQLGLTVVDIKPVGLEGSGGSTPLRLRVAGEPDTYLFGKLYAMNHVRADRWYKVGRTILYGRLEDEAPFQSVRRLVLRCG
jgi:hypothetical protein